MASIALFHSVLGLREVEMEAAARLRDAGHEVLLPDLFDGTKTDDLDEGFAIKAKIGWKTIRERAWTALADSPDRLVLMGISMGAGVVAEMWKLRPDVQGVLLLHGLASLPAGVCAGTPVQLHIGLNDPIFTDTELHAWKAKTVEAKLSADVFTYQNSGHYFTDITSADYSEEATARLWCRALSFLRAISR
ncbi:dienelactone hydrolase [Azospirillum lipoferum]|uniref:Dienelactone hydrolase family protein n=1 Tax=Azospirillum lipoferum TaxID=193 RepID=A0A5A9GKP0_AZOLI|nr:MULTISPECIES: dienelactone hydrolase family protein [Azospirillum]KAA0594991.1 dienelactone hydrolase family protein [Azospirillum lipoferum]MCP1612668.1 dienelactone hydrolase [Azospirillum lipoferum]MDW5532191.1 dienelactone hydrolase family protein [Azospirillum sp. NL1]